MYFYIILILTSCVAQYHTATTYSTNVKVRVLPNMAINTMGLLSWYPNYSNEPINKACPWNDTQACSSNYNPFTVGPCELLTYFNRPVCGGQSCYYNKTTKKCSGQCANPILQTCVSKAYVPQDDSDCVCGSSVANPKVVNSKTGQWTQTIPSCDTSNCFGNPCSFFYVSVDRLTNRTLYAACINDKPQ
jgi:hypothetical protein